MTLSRFGTIIGKFLIEQRNGRVRRCQFPDVVFAAPEGQHDVDTVIVGCGPNSERARLDLISKIHGKVARRYVHGRRLEFPVPNSLTP